MPNPSTIAQEDEPERPYELRDHAQTLPGRDLPHRPSGIILASSDGDQVVSTPPDETENGGSPAGDTGFTAARERALYAIRALMESDPEGWPELLASVAGIACEQDCGSLDLLADASVQVAARAHKRRYDRSRENN